MPKLQQWELSDVISLWEYLADYVDSLEACYDRDCAQVTLERVRDELLDRGCTISKGFVLPPEG